MDQGGGGGGGAVDALVCPAPQQGEFLALNLNHLKSASWGRGRQETMHLPSLPLLLCTPEIPFQ